MSRLSDPEVEGALELLTSDPARTGILADFDGTISEVVLDPHTARPRPGALEAVHELAGLIGIVAVVSGRPAAFLAERLELDRYRSGVRAIGLHGLEEARADGTVAVRPGVAAWRPALEVVRDEVTAAVRPGVRVEDKGYGLTVHWRSATLAPEGIAELAELTRTVVGAIGRSHGLEVRSGKQSVELALPLGIDKGTVVRELCGPLARAAYLGDDAGDIVAFRALDELGVAGRGSFESRKIAVSSAEAPAALLEAADLVLPGPASSVAFLIELRDRLRSA